MNRVVSEPSPRGPADPGPGSLSPPAAGRLPAREAAMPPPPRLPRAVPLSALFTLLRITAERQLRGRRLLVLCALFALPILFAVLAHRLREPYHAAEVETILIFTLIPQALLPLASLLFATGMVQDDVEEQTLTYLLIRPIPRWLIYLGKVAATWLVTAALAAVFSSAALVAIYWGTGELTAAELVRRALVLSALLGLGLLAYTALFGGLSLLIRRSLALGVAYIAVFEGVVANMDFLVRRLTVMYYIRTLSIRWLDLSGGDWSIDPAKAPSTVECLVCLLSATAALALLGALVFSIREFRVKTPEGS